MRNGMALADIEAPVPGYAFTNQMNPDGSMGQRYVGGGFLPNGFNSGAFNSDGSLRWASNAIGVGPAMRPAAPAPAITQPIPQRFNLAGLFNGGPMRAPSGGGSGGMFSTTRSAAVQAPINQAYSNRNANATTEAQSLKDYAAQVLSGQPKAEAAANQEINSINQIYGTGVDSLAAQLAQLNRQEQAAGNIAAQHAAARVRRGINAQRAGGGSSSYLDRLMAQQLYGIGAENAGRGAQQSRNDLTWLTGQRTGAVGRRQTILDQLAQRGLAPTFAGQQIESGALGNLGRLAGLDYGNNIYEHPEDVARRRLDFMDYLSPYLDA